MSYFRPTILEDALDWLSTHDARIVAGSTDLFPSTDRQTLDGHILDITAIEELRELMQTDKGWSIGAATTWSDIISSDLPPAFDGLKLAAREVGSIQIQNAGTVAGNICNASPAADGIPCLLSLDSSVELISVRGRRSVPLASFIAGPRKTTIASDEIVTRIIAPQDSCKGTSHFLKLGARKYLIISIAMVATRLLVEDGIIAQAGISVGACTPVAVRLTEAETALVGKPAIPSSITSISDPMIQNALLPIDDIRATGEYRSMATAELVRRSLNRLVSKSMEAAA